MTKNAAFTIKLILVLICLYVIAGKAIAQESLLNSSFAGQWPYHPSKAIAVDLQRQFIYLGDGNIISVLDLDLNLLSSLIVTNSGQISGLYFDETDNFLYVVCQTDGLKIYNISNILDPQLISTYLPDVLEVTGVFLNKSKVFLSSGIDGLIILDIADINNISVLSQSRLPGGFGISYAMDTYAAGDFAFVADLYNGLHIVDISNPANPDYQKGIALAGATDMSVSDTYLYLTLQSSGMATLDISAPENTFVTSLFSVEDVATSVRVADEFAFISYYTTGVRAIDITDKTEPFSDPAWVYGVSGASSLSLLQGTEFLFCTNDQFGLQKIDISNKSAMQPLAVYDTPADAVAIDVSGNYIYSIDSMTGNESEKEGLRIHEINTFTGVATFYYQGFCATPGTASDIKVTGNFAFVADGENGLQIISISDKTKPEIIGHCDTPGYSSGIYIDGNHAYIADGSQGIAIIDIADKTNPILSAQLYTDTFAQKIFVSGDYAYVASKEHGLGIIDITNKINPAIAGIHDTPGTASGIFVRNFYAYVADGEKGLAILDISDKTTPALVAAIDTDGFANDIIILGNYAYVADRVNGLTVIDVSTPSQPVLVPGWSYNSTGMTSDVSGYSSDDEELYAFLADGAAGIVAVNLRIEDEDGSDEGASKTGSGGCFVQTVVSER